jgi:hypothetical protein
MKLRELQGPLLAMAVMPGCWTFSTQMLSTFIGHVSSDKVTGSCQPVGAFDCFRATYIYGIQTLFPPFSFPEAGRNQHR